MGAHLASFFDHNGFVNEARPLVAEVDGGRIDALKIAANRAVSELRGKWAFEEMGNGRLDSIDIGNVDPASGWQVGNLFLIVLAKYLKDGPSPSGNWTTLNDALQIIGWDAKKRNLLFKGKPTYLLLKPHERVEDPMQLSEKLPYWMWLQPNWARSGWLSTQDIKDYDLLSGLKKVKKDIDNFDLRQLPIIEIDNPTVFKDYEREGYLVKGYQYALDMLESAVERKQGLFMSVRFMN